MESVQETVLRQVLLYVAVGSVACLSSRGTYVVCPEGIDAESTPLTPLHTQTTHARTPGRLQGRTILHTQRGKHARGTGQKGFEDFFKETFSGHMEMIFVDRKLLDLDSTPL